MPAPRADLQLSIGYWIVSHKDTLRKWWAITLIAFIGLVFIWTTVFALVYFSQAGQITQQMALRLQQAGTWPAGAINGPAAITTTDTSVIIRDLTHVDLAATLSNPNSTWGAATVQAHFEVDGKAVPSQTVFVNPSVDRPVVALNVAVTDSAQAQAKLVIESTDWAKVNSNSLPAANFRVDHLTVTPTTVTVNGQAVPTMRLQASVTNQSVYNFRHVVVPIVLMTEHGIVAVDEITTDTWPTLTSKSIETTWSYPVTGAVTAQLTPQVSRFDTNNVYR